MKAVKEQLVRKSQCGKFIFLSGEDSGFQICSVSGGKDLSLFGKNWPMK